MKTPKPYLIPAFAAMLVSLAGCDIVQKDASPNELVKQAYTFAEKPAVINLSTITQESDFELEQIDNPSFGNLELIRDKENKPFLVYTPGASFIGQQENLRMNLVNKSTGEVLSKLNVGVESLEGKTTSCSRVSGIYDNAKIKPGETLVLDLLDNDVFCGVTYNGGIISSHDIENAELVHVAIGPGRRAELTYTAPENFTGKVRLMYDLGVNWKVNVERIPDDVILANPDKYLEAFTTAMVEIEVAN